MNQQFTQDWAGDFVRNMKRFVLDSDRRISSYLEVGVFEGRSLQWVLENVLLPSGFAVGIDPWIEPEGFDGETVFERARSNLKPYKHCGLVRARLRDVAGGMTPGMFDCIYIDGDHSAIAAMEDTVLAWPLLRSGGLMIWDDTEWEDERYQVADAVDWFLPRASHVRLPAVNQVWVQKS